MPIAAYDVSHLQLWQIIQPALKPDSRQANPGRGSGGGGAEKEVGEIPTGMTSFSVGTWGNKQSSVQI